MRQIMNSSIASVAYEASVQLKDSDSAILLPVLASRRSRSRYTSLSPLKGASILSDSCKTPQLEVSTHFSKDRDSSCSIDSQHTLV